jgi:parallel beta-helix repeat protein
MAPPYPTDTGSVPFGEGMRMSRFVRIAVPALFVVAVVAAVVLEQLHAAPSSPVARATARASSGMPNPTSSSIPTAFPDDPVPYTRPDVTGSPPEAPSSDTISTSTPISSFEALAASLPSGVLRADGNNSWTLNQPVSIEGRATVSITGPAELAIESGAFLLATNGGNLSLERISVTGVGANGALQATPATDRGFLAATTGGRLVLEHDSITDLGYLGDYTYGISLQETAPGSTIRDCSIRGDYFGVYLSHSRGVPIVGNRVSDSVVYGIDPHTDSSRLLIEGNRVTDSGVHGNILADGVTDTQVIGNAVSGSGDHGIVLFDGANQNVVSGNSLSGVFDGIVVTDSSDNRISRNTIGPAKRFGIRLSGGDSKGNVVVANNVSSSLVGAYVEAGVNDSTFTDNQWAGNVANVIVAGDGSETTVTPVPPRSRLGR